MRRIDYLLVAFLAVLVCGCASRTATAPPAADVVQPQASKVEVDPRAEKAAKIGSLEISLEKQDYVGDEPIRIKYKFKANKFDLNLETAPLSAEGLLSKTMIKSASGDIVSPKKTIQSAEKIDTIKIGNREIKAAPGFTLKKGESIEMTVDDLREYYRLKPGTYTLQASLVLRVYGRTRLQKSESILSIEREINSIRNDPHLSQRAKEDAIKNLQQDIANMIAENSDLEKTYVILDSVKGQTPPIKSNVVSFTVTQ